MSFKFGTPKFAKIGNVKKDELIDDFTLSADIPAVVITWFNTLAFSRIDPFNNVDLDALNPLLPATVGLPNPQTKPDEYKIVKTSRGPRKVKQRKTDPPVSDPYKTKILNLLKKYLSAYGHPENSYEMSEPTCCQFDGGKIITSFYNDSGNPNWKALILHDPTSNLNCIIVVPKFATETNPPCLS